MEIKQLNHNTIDVFIGKGWEQWGRFKIAHKQDGVKLFQIGGNRFPKEVQASLEKQYNA
jgi:hypothetical protein